MVPKLTNLLYNICRCFGARSNDMVPKRYLGTLAFLDCFGARSNDMVPKLFPYNSYRIFRFGARSNDMVPKPRKSNQQA